MRNIVSHLRRTPRTPNDSRLLTVPKEIRLMIYELVFEDVHLGIGHNYDSDGFNLCRTNHLIAPESANIIFVCTLTYIEACSMLYSLCWLRLGLKPSKDIAKLSRNVLRYTKYVQVDNKDSLLWLLKWLHKFESLRDFQIGPSLLLVGTPHTKLDSILRQIDQQLQQRKTLLRNIVKDEKGNLQAAFE